MTKDILLISEKTGFMMRSFLNIPEDNGIYADVTSPYRANVTLDPDRGIAFLNLFF